MESIYELEQKPGIKAQHAVYRALKRILEEANSGWDVEETPVGSQQDHDGIDIWLTNKATGDSFILDVSFRRKEDDTFLLLIRHEWFEENLKDGTFTLRKEYLRALLRAVLPILSMQPVKRDVTKK